MPKKKISPQSAKQKGRKLQQWVCEKVSELTGYEWGSSGDDKPIESRPMGQSGTDVRMESQVRKEFPFSVECKWQERWNVLEWIKQAQENKEENTDWLLIIKKNNHKQIAVLDAEKFFELLQNQKRIRKRNK